MLSLDESLRARQQRVDAPHRPELGRTALLVIDGVATLWPELQQACFAIWRRKFARLRETAQVLAEPAEWAASC